MNGNNKVLESPYSDGSPDDERHWKLVKESRRAGMTDERAVQKILGYLDQCLKVLEIEKRQCQESKNVERERQVQDRMKWTEAMAIWVNHNC